MLNNVVMYDKKNYLENVVSSLYSYLPPIFYRNMAGVMNTMALYILFS